MRISIPDEALAPLEPHLSAERPIEVLAALALSRINHIGPQDRYLLLDAAQVAQLEERLQTTLGTPQDLWQAVDRLADLKLGNISFRFTEAQWRELKDRAAREQTTVEQFTLRVLTALIPLFFQTAPAQAPPELVRARK